MMVMNYDEQVLDWCGKVVMINVFTRFGGVQWLEYYEFIVKYVNYDDNRAGVRKSVLTV